MENHHAILLVGNSLLAVNIDIKKLRQETEVDFIDVDTLSISDVRKVITSAFGRPLEHQTKTILIKAGVIAIEAQNALLKILEEPPATTKFILVLPGLNGLLPTLLSRLTVDKVEGETDIKLNDFFTTFTNITIGEKINLIAEIAKNKDDEQYKFLYEGLVNWLVFNSNHKNKSQIHWCLNQLNMRGASKKMLWEEIALLM